jgi:ATP-dependent Clp protease ATP-binding subunit ClpX
MLIRAANGDIDATRSGIVFIDEIDKLRAGWSGFKDMRLGVQHALIKMLEGPVVMVPAEGGNKRPMQPAFPST